MVLIPHRTEVLTYLQEDKFKEDPFAIRPQEVDNAIQDILQFGTEEQIQSLIDAFNNNILTKRENADYPVIRKPTQEEIDEIETESIREGFNFRPYSSAILSSILDPNCGQHFNAPCVTDPKSYAVFHSGYSAWVMAGKPIAKRKPGRPKTKKETSSVAYDRSAYVEVCNTRKEQLAAKWAEYQQACRERKEIDIQFRVRCQTLYDEYINMKNCPKPSKDDFK